MVTKSLWKRLEALERFIGTEAAQRQKLWAMIFAKAMEEACTADELEAMTASLASDEETFSIPPEIEPRLYEAFDRICLRLTGRQPAEAFPEFVAEKMMLWTQR